MAITKPDMEFVWASGGAIVEPSDTKKQTGWTAEVPPHQWENWIQNRQDQYLAHINERGIPEWDGNTNYLASGLSYVQGSDGKIYKSVAASGPATTIQDPTTDATDTYWTVAFASKGDIDASEITTGALPVARGGTGVTTSTGTGSTVLSNSPTFTGTPAAPTPPQFGNNTSIATTAFVQRALGNAQASVFLSSTSVMTANAFGRFFWAGGSSAYNIDLPTLAISPTIGGGVIEIFCTNPAGVTVRRSSTDNILINQNSITQITLQPGQSARFVSHVEYGVWYMTGEAQLPYSSSFGASLTANGYQRLPSGLIIQWGVNNLSNTSSLTTFNLPIAFPNAGFQIVGTHNAPAADSSVTTALEFVSNSQVRGRVYAQAFAQVRWIAIGR